MSLRCAVRVRISGLSAAQAGTVMEALGPDNAGAPPGLDISMAEEEGEEIGTRALVIECTSSDGGDGDGGNDAESGDLRALGRLIGTVDEMLEHAQVSLRVVTEKDA